MDGWQAETKAEALHVSAQGTVQDMGPGDCSVVEQ